MKIHCFSCGRDTETDEVKQFSEKSILRCKRCHSLNFKPLGESIPLPVQAQEIKNDMDMGSGSDNLSRVTAV